MTRFRLSGPANAAITFGTLAAPPRRSRCSSTESQPDRE
jgi:hypothetical protein